jgi:hypothetical protein
MGSQEAPRRTRARAGRRRYEWASTIITSNRALAEWAPLFKDELLASAALDRLLQHTHVVEITGHSYRNPPAVATQGSRGLSLHSPLILPMATVDPMRQAEASILGRHPSLDLGGHPSCDPVRRAEGDPVWRSFALCTSPGTRPRTGPRPCSGLDLGGLGPPRATALASQHARLTATRSSASWSPQAQSTAERPQTLPRNPFLAGHTPMPRRLRRRSDFGLLSGRHRATMSSTKCRRINSLLVLRSTP